MKTPRVKLVPPRLPARTSDARRSNACLRTRSERRLTLIVAGAGFGKSTLAASVAIERGWSCTGPMGLTALPGFAKGSSDALHLELLTEPFAAGAADALGNALAQTLDEKLHQDVVLVLDDVHELGDRQESAHVLETLVRLGPPELHLVLAPRRPAVPDRASTAGRDTCSKSTQRCFPFSKEETSGVVDSFAPACAADSGPDRRLAGGCPSPPPPCWRT